MSSQRQIVLCFDGTGNTFRADGTETNVLRICGMLQRTDDQCKCSLVSFFPWHNFKRLTSVQCVIISVRDINPCIEK